MEKEAGGPENNLTRKTATAQFYHTDNLSSQEEEEQFCGKEAGWARESNSDSLRACLPSSKHESQQHCVIGECPVS
jgi:hypothetical protein